MKIDRNQPLPAHTKLKYEECLAKVVLKGMFPDRYAALEISDKPDLRDTRHNIGIEVTSSEPSEEREASRLWSTINFMDEGAKKQRNIDRLGQLGVEYTDGMQIWPAKSFFPNRFETTPCFDFFQAYKEKVTKLNQGHYAELSEYDLFVHSDWFIWPYEPDSWMPPLLEMMVEENKNAKKFSYVYLKGPSAIFIWNLVSRNYNVIYKEDNFLHYCLDAREMVISKEENIK